MPEWSVLGKLRFDLGIEDLRIKVVLRDFETQTKGNKIAVRDKRGGGEDYYRIRSYFFINKYFNQINSEIFSYQMSNY